MSESISSAPRRREDLGVTGADLTSTVDEERLQSVWDGVVARRHAAKRSRFAMPALVAGGVVAGLGLVVAGQQAWPSRPAAADRAREPAPLRQASGDPLPATVGPEERLALDDGSRLSVEGGLLRLEENAARHLTWRLGAGRARFEVTPGGPRRWTIWAGDTRVRVVGTVFSVERRGEHGNETVVTVEHGLVEVSAPSLSTTARVGAGERLVVRATHVAPTGVPDVRPPARPTREAIGAETARAKANAVASRQAAPRRRPSGTDPGPTAPAPSAASGTRLADALDAADRARRQGRYGEAAAKLRDALAAPDDADLVGVAELTLGRLYLRHLDAPASAARLFESAARRRWPTATRETLHQLQLEACGAAADERCARRAADAWVRDDPGAASRPDVARWR